MVRLNRIVLILMSALVLGGTLSAGGPRRLEGYTIQSGILAVGIHMGNPPLEYLDADGNPVGFDVQLAQALAVKLGLKLKFVDVPWDGIFDGLNADRYDCVISSVTITGERAAAYSFTRPYAGNTQAMVLLRGSKARVRNPRETAGLRVAYQAETTSDNFMAKVAGEGVKFTGYEYNRAERLFEVLLAGQVDALVCDSLVAVGYVIPADSPFEIVWQGPAEEQFGICLKRGNRVLTEVLNRTLDQLFEDGTLLRMSRDVFKIDMVSSVRNQPF